MTKLQTVRGKMVTPHFSNCLYALEQVDGKRKHPGAINLKNGDVLVLIIGGTSTNRLLSIFKWRKEATNCDRSRVWCGWVDACKISHVRAGGRENMMEIMKENGVSRHGWQAATGTMDGERNPTEAWSAANCTDVAKPGDDDDLRFPLFLKLANGETMWID